MGRDLMIRVGAVLMVFSTIVFGAESGSCGNNEQARLLAQLIKSDPEQKRTEIRCNKILTEAAEAKAKKMAEHGLVMHNLGGSPNARLQQAGYKLPDRYGYLFDSNQVEAIAGGYADAHEVWEGFKDSFGHRRHLLGEHEFYIKQDEIGVGFVKKWKSPHVEYWVVYLTKGYTDNQTYADNSGDIPNKNTHTK